MAKQCTFDVILGRDFFRQVGLTIDFGNSTMTCMDNLFLYILSHYLMIEKVYMMFYYYILMYLFLSNPNMLWKLLKGSSTIK